METRTDSTGERKVLDRPSRGLQSWAHNRGPMWGAFYPRHYPAPEGYVSPMKSAVELCYVVDGAFPRPGGGRLGSSLAYEMFTNYQWEAALFGAFQMTELRVPTYFVTPELAMKALGPAPEGDIFWNTMAMPTGDAALFMLPKGVLTHGGLGEISYVWYARVAPARHELSHGFRLRLAKETFVYRTELKGDGKRGVKKELLNQNLSNSPINLREFELLKAEAAGDETQLALLRLLGLVFNLLVFTARTPALIKPGLYTGSKTRLGQEIWTPTMLG